MAHVSQGSSVCSTVLPGLNPKQSGLFIFPRSYLNCSAMSERAYQHIFAITCSKYPLCCCLLRLLAMELCKLTGALLQASCTKSAAGDVHICCD